MNVSIGSVRRIVLVGLLPMMLASGCSIFDQQRDHSVPREENLNNLVRRKMIEADKTVRWFVTGLGKSNLDRAEDELDEAEREIVRLQNETSAIQKNYCYRTLSSVDCYDAPLEHSENRRMGRDTEELMAARRQNKLADLEMQRIALERKRQKVERQAELAAQAALAAMATPVDGADLYGTELQTTQNAEAQMQIDKSDYPSGRGRPGFLMKEKLDKPIMSEDSLQDMSEASNETTEGSPEMLGVVPQVPAGAEPAPSLAVNNGLIQSKSKVVTYNSSGKVVQ